MSRRALGGMCALVAIAVTWWCLSYTNTRSLIEDARKCRADNPRQAERLLRRALDQEPSVNLEAQAVLASVLLQQSDWDAAADLINDKLLNNAPTDALVELAAQANKVHRRQLAHRVLTAVSQRPGPQQRTALLQLIGSGEPGRTTYEMAPAALALAKLEPENPRWWWLSVEAVSAGGDPSELIDVLHTAIQQKLPPRDTTEFRHRLVDQTILLGDAEAARAAMSALESQRQVSPARLHIHRARLLRLEGHSRQALQELNRGLARFPNVPAKALRLRGIMQMDIGNLDSAVVDLKRAAQSLKNDTILHYKLAECYRRLGKPQLAAQHRRRFQELKKQSAPDRNGTAPPPGDKVRHGQ